MKWTYPSLCRTERRINARLVIFIFSGKSGTLELFLFDGLHVRDGVVVALSGFNAGPQSPGILRELARRRG